MKRVLPGLIALFVIIDLTGACASGGWASSSVEADHRLGPGQHDLVLGIGGDEREYRLYVPRGLDGRERVPLMIVLHGGGGWGKQIEDMSRMDSQSDAAGFLVAYPNGTRGLIGYTWNGGDCCGVAMRKESDDVAFISALIDELVEHQRVDPNRVYVTGISNGGIMAHRIGCELSTKVAGIAPIAGAMMVEECRPAEPINVIFFHGTADKAVQVGGNYNKKSGPRRAFPALNEQIVEWRKLNRCPDKGEVTYDKGEVQCRTYGPCAEGTEVAVCMISGGGHTWPGGKPIMERQLGHTTSDISANEAMWDFFRDQPLRPQAEDRKEPEGPRKEDRKEPRGKRLEGQPETRSMHGDG
jgi:polyhydroxybutyrate depolymerase